VRVRNFVKIGGWDINTPPVHSLYGAADLRSTSGGALVQELQTVVVDEFRWRMVMRSSWCVLFLLACAPLCVYAAVSVEIYESDGLTPFDGRPLMVGSHVCIVVSSDVAGYWGGGLFITGDDRALARLYGRGRDPDSCDWRDSHYPAAGDDARVISWMNQDMWGFDTYTSDANGLPGRWFILDYEAIGVGEPNLQVFDYAHSFTDPNGVIAFSHVPSRDFNGDGLVNIIDYAMLASHWEAADCFDPNGCGRVDLNGDRLVDVKDLALFADYWLWGVPRQPLLPVDPEVTYRLTDALGSNEISLAVGENITLYISMETHDTNVNLFNLEVNVSDPALGGIDNTPYDPESLPNHATARILAQPRDTFFDDFGPGQQPGSISFSAASIISPMNDGWIASFVYTSLAPGDVKLELTDLLGGHIVRLEPMIIHQIDGLLQATSATTMMTEGGKQPVSTQLTVEEMVERLEDIYRTDAEMQKLVSRDRWQNFINDVKKSESLAR